MTERARFVALSGEGLYSMTELCERFGISRKTAYKWLERFQHEGLPGLEDRSRAPKGCPHRTSKTVETALLQVRERHPHWGPKKLQPLSDEPEQITQQWPVASTRGAILAPQIKSAARLRPHLKGVPLQRSSRRLPVPQWDRPASRPVPA